MFPKLLSFYSLVISISVKSKKNKEEINGELFILKILGLCKVLFFTVIDAILKTENWESKRYNLIIYESGEYKLDKILKLEN